MNTEQERAAFEALELIAATDPIEAALDPQRAIRVAREALRLYDAAKVRDYARVAMAATPAPALYVGLIERLMRLSTRLGIAHEGGVEHFAAGLEDRLYAICRAAEGLLDSLAATPAPEPLTESALCREVCEYGPQSEDEEAGFRDGFRAAERVHGIGKEASNG